MTKLHLACQSAQSRVIRANGLRLHLLESGLAGAPALLVLHGGSAHCHWFDLVTPPFADRFRIVALDQRGHGKSEWAVPPAYATEDFASDLAAVIDQLGLGRVLLVGHSMGGHNAMAFAAWYAERLAGLVIVDARPALPEERLHQLRQRGTRPLGRHPSAEAAIERFRLIPLDTVADPRLLAHLARTGIVERAGAWMYRFDRACDASRKPVDAWGLLERIHVPTLVVRGEYSPVLPRDKAERVCQAIPDAQLVEIPGAYHHLVLDKPEAFVAALERFVDDAHLLP